MKSRKKLSKFEWVKKNIVIVPVVAAILAGTFTSIRYVLNLTDTIEANKQTLINLERDLEENTEFRIKWPRGQLGALPADSEQYMMIEDLYKTTDKLNKHIENMALNKVNIEFLRKQMDKVLEDIESLKDEARDMHYKNGNGQ